MLHELDIESYAVVERLRVLFQPGLNLLTGETGSGKSIVVDSLALLFGARASAEMVRSGARRARVSGIFDVPQDPAVRERLAQSGVEIDGDLIVERQVLSTGKSRAYVNGAPATVAAKLAELLDTAAASYLVGQFAFGDLTLVETTHSIELFADRVMPVLAG